MSAVIPLKPRSQPNNSTFVRESQNVRDKCRSGDVSILYVVKALGL